jgi:pectate lyase C
MFRTIFVSIVFSGTAFAQNPPMPGPITGATCVSAGTVIVNTTIRVNAGTFDGGCRTYVAGPFMGEHDEVIDPMFILENGARLRNVIIGPSRQGGRARAAHIFAGATLDNVNITKADYDSPLSIKTAGTVTFTRFTAQNSNDHLITASGINTRVNISNCVFRNARKVYRQLGGTNYPTHVTIDRCDIANMSDEVFRTDSQNSTAKLTNSRLTAVRRVCTGYATGKCVTSGIVND